MKRILYLCMLVAVPALAAQQPLPPDSGQARADELRQRVMQRWRMRVREELRLTDDQAGKMQATEDRFFQRRRDIMQRQRAVLEGLHNQLQPGVAANADSVRRLMDARERNRAAMLDVERDEDKELAGYLMPVQHARYQLMRQRLQERIAEMRRGRTMGPDGPRMGPPDRRPMGPGRRPRP